MKFDEWDEEEKRESPFLSEVDIEDFEERMEEHDYLLGDPLTYD